MPDISTTKKIIFHNPLLSGVIFALEDIFKRGYHADQVIERLFKSHPNWGSRDRGLVAECTYDIVRFWRFYSFISGTNEKTDRDSLLIRIAIWSRENNVGSPQFHEFSFPTEEEWKKVIEKANLICAIRESIPDWIDELGKAEIGENWEKEIHALNQQAPLVIRVNTLKCTKDTLVEKLEIAGWETSGHPLSAEALVCAKRGNIFSTSEFKEGFFEVQDAGSQSIAPFLQAGEGMRVVDGCAGAGGKALHLSALMKNKGHILALDKIEWKLVELKKRAKRNGAHNIETRLVENSKAVKRLYQSADRLLLDVPCSGMGTLRRNPDIKWKLSLEKINELQMIQQEILVSYSKIVKPGGKMVYATCSILPAENHLQVEKFLKNEPGWKLEEEKMIWPSENNSDGFYMARMALKE